MTLEVTLKIREDTFISFKILKDQKLVQKQTVTLYESPNTCFLEKTKVHSWLNSVLYVFALVMRYYFLSNEKLLKQKYYKCCPNSLWEQIYQNF